MAMNLGIEDSSVEDHEKRQRSRCEFDYTVLCFHLTDAAGNEHHSFVNKIKVLDISYSGIGISSNHKFEKNDQLRINITYKNSNIMEYSGIVKWCARDQGNYKSGLEFVEMTREHIYLLDDIIKGKGRKIRK